MHLGCWARYLLLLRWMARRYAESVDLLPACVSDNYAEEDVRIITHLGTVRGALRIAAPGSRHGLDCLKLFLS